jgi:hypothetical protein
MTVALDRVSDPLRMIDLCKRALFAPTCATKTRKALLKPETRDHALSDRTEATE